jgi:NAD(P)H-nitrite reductase large subunit
MQNFELVIAGGGLTAARAIKSYRDHDVEVLLGTAASAVDADARTVTTDAGSFTTNTRSWSAAASSAWRWQLLCVSSGWPSP